MKRSARVDNNQKEIVKALRSIGATVESLASVGCGVPDLLVGYHGTNYLLEVKDGEKPPSKQRLTPDETNWHLLWRGRVAIVRTVEEAIEMVLEQW